MMRRKVIDALQRLKIPAEARILVGLSGGADSTALLLMLKELGYSVCALHVNHGIRGEEARRDEEFCEALCEKFAIPFRKVFTDIPALCREKKQGTEQTARQERYRLLRRAKQEFQADYIATAHNAEDNAETVLLHMVRGTGLSGLCGIPAKRDCIIRPFLSVSRREILDFLESRGQNYMTDSTNSDTDYARNRIRGRVVPELCRINPEWVGAIGRMTELLSADRQILEELSGMKELSCKNLLSVPPPVAMRCIRRAYTEFCGEILSMEASERCLALCENPRPSAVCELPGCRLRRNYNELIFEKKNERPMWSAVPLPESGEISIPEAGVRLLISRECAPENIYNSVNSFYLSCDKMGASPVIRHRQTGDSFRKNPQGVRKTLKKKFIDDKISVCERDRIPVIASENGVLAVVGWGADADHSAVAGEMSLRIRVLHTDREIDPGNGPEGDRAE